MTNLELSILQEMHPLAREKILPIFAMTAAERRKHHGIDLRNGQLSDIELRAKHLEHNIALLFEYQKKYDWAEDLFKRHNTSFPEAARTALAQGKKEQAAQYLRNVERLDYYDTGFTLDIAKEIFSKSELETYTQNILKTITERHRRPNPIEAKIAIIMGNTPLIEEIYSSSKEALKKSYEKENKHLEASMETREDLWEVTKMNEDHHAEICELLGKTEEAAKIYLHSHLNRQVILKDKFDTYVKRHNEDSLFNIYEEILDKEIDRTNFPNYLVAANAAEKLRDTKRAQIYFQKALADEEKDLNLFLAFQIAEKLKLDKKTQAIKQITEFAYSQGYI